ncbi:hypothetical protein Glove_87g248 [Diversispora epigaea]|uniref:Uncharacterized protein n=1 Tax=Diversispora epigaea TaxID=1348612 RepID=A0A397J8K2_9GLOM|nr:hypothetical protein Glove_87g248 [Diversispora epigaea]
MTENKLLPYNEIPILPIKHNFFNESDDETIRSDTEEKEELIDNELFENFSDIGDDDETLENLNDSDKSIINLESVEAKEPLILSSFLICATVLLKYVAHL